MVISTSKPAEIKVLSVQDDVKRGIFKVRYAFRVAIQETTTTIEEYDEEGNVTQKEVPAWQYEEFVDEIELPLYLKPSLDAILKTMYDKAKPVLEANAGYASAEVPSEISVDEED
ncbi:hypothetical protein SU69_07350 [Thermosipho melanesiensis]|uniref:Uncharacterized protein n=2 Tax=Thermosipho melanesiensis TaxID=46541 RepID=A6LMZ4_THEM4|nr:hypothetical protein [Thermosipho melanesiensis]ABR31295.1 hypothetical protein Tmel_1448 [Thermosipho melanesiensis BI429]APT74908.1 hypothetical protein BW47_07680 [Thermosipho melanesiensis]OOC36317.1 hypothetical protein SU68_07420 [Thermosipho melanesiensis]OOC37135.1 hypothetical protein SU69_07350 [Thermosipho melanesiensis]OOC37887.1 hypothetical protein SU70_07360 [Thermosipho melanesiensis]